MDEYESNSFKSKEDQKNPRKKKTEKVISGTVKKKEKTGFQKFLDLFVADDLHSMGTYIISDVLVPATKRAFLDTVSTILYGNAAGIDSGSTRKKNLDNASYSNYSSYYSGNHQQSKVSILKDSDDFENVVIPSRGEAQLVYDKIIELYNSYGNVSIADFYDMVGVNDDNYTHNDWGWDSIEGIGIIHVRDGYMISFPKAKPL